MRRNIDVKIVGLARGDAPFLNLVRNFMRQDNEPHYGKQPNHQKNFTWSNPSRAAALPLRQSAFVNFRCAPKDKDQRPPVAKQVAKLEPAVVVEQN